MDKKRELLSEYIDIQVMQEKMICDLEKVFYEPYEGEMGHILQLYADLTAEAIGLDLNNDEIFNLIYEWCAEEVQGKGHDAYSVEIKDMDSTTCVSLTLDSKLDLVEAIIFILEQKGKNKNEDC